MKILVLRNDKIGDFSLALPAFEIVRRGLPGAEITALVPAYTAELAELCPHIDRVLLDPGPAAAAGTPRALASAWRAEGFDAMLSLWSAKRTALAGWRARIPRRIAPATKLHQWLHNERLVQRRSRSIQPEYAYNNDLARHGVRLLGGDPPAEFTRPVLPLDGTRLAERRAALRADLGLRDGQPLVLLHPGHGGSSNNLSPGQYADLLRRLQSAAGHGVLVTAGPGEQDAARRVVDAEGSGRCRVFESTGGLGAFCHVLASADCVLGGSTGPLHLAGALGARTAGFYVRRRTSSALRWRTLAPDGRRLEFEVPQEADERDMSAIDLGAAAAMISSEFLGAGPGAQSDPGP